MKHLAIFFICAASLSAQGLSGLFGGGSNAKRIQGVSVKSSLGCTDGQVLTYVAAETQFECTDVSVEGGSGDITGVTAGTGLTGGGTSGGVTLAIDSSVVTGAASLTTAGACVYVASSGVLAQDSPGCHWDATNNRLGLGTASPSSVADITGSGAGAILKVSNTAASSFVPIFSTLAPNITAGQSAYFAIGRAESTNNSASLNFTYAGSGSTSNRLGFYMYGSTELMSILGSGSIGIGPGNTSPIGTFHVYDATATTGDTVVLLRDGALSGSAARINFSPNGSNTADAGLRHVSTNNLAVTNGSSTTYWTLGLGGIQSGVTTWNDPSSSGTVASKSILGIAAPTLTASSSTTFTTASTLRIGGAPTASTNVSIGTAYALEVAAGNSYFAGAVTAGGNIAAANVNSAIGGAVFWTSRSQMYSDADGNIRMNANAGSGFGCLQLGGTSTSFSAWCRSGTTLQARLADNSADAPISASNVTASGDFIGSSTSCIYLGATGTDGSWRWCRSGNNAVMERRESGSWVSKQVVTP